MASKNLVNIVRSMKFREELDSRSVGVSLLHKVQRESVIFIRSPIQDLAGLGILGPQGG